MTSESSETFETKIERIQRAANVKLPQDYVDWLAQHRRKPDDEGDTPFDVDQLLETQRIVQDILPQGTVAIGDDGYGNLVLIRCSDGSILWQFHEDLDDIEVVGSSIHAFLERVAAHHNRNRQS